MDKIWLNRYPEDVPADIDPARYPSLLEVFEESVAKNADRIAYINMGQVMTYRRVEEQSRAFAAYLQNELKLQKGDRVAIMMPNLLQYPICLFGALRAGVTVVNVNPLYTPRELKHQLNDSGATTIVLVSNFAHTLEEVVADTPVKNVILTSLGDQLSPTKRTLVNFVVKYVKKMVPKYNLPGAQSLRYVLSKGQHLQYIRPKVEAEDLAFLQYTGGTTGVAKGAMLSHRNMVANLLQAQAIVGPCLREHEELVVTALPLYHIFALLANGLLFFMLGCQNLLITNPRDIPNFVKELGKVKFTAITGVNTLFNALVNHPDFSKLDFSQLRLSMGGGMAVQKAVADRWQSVTHCRLIEGYGLTECAPLVTVCPYNLEAYNGSIGLPAPSTDVKLVDENGKEVGLGEAGELLVQGPQVMRGYWQREQATKEAMPDGWFATGDIATVDEDGFFHIVDRKKDMILVSGFNVFPNEVEEVVAMHDGVLEVAAVGVPHNVSGEVVKIFVVKREANLTEESLLAHCKENLTAYKVPKLVEFREELPKTNVGKILRRALRDEQ